MKASTFLIVALFLAATSCLAALPRSTPEAEGVSSESIREFVTAVDKEIHSLNSFMLVRHGRVIAEGWWAPYEREVPHVLFSLSKSFTSTAVGLAVAEGKLSVNDEVLKFFPEDAPAEPSQNLKAMRVRDLLRMNTGHRSEPPRPPEGSWKKAFLAHPVDFKPGTHFLYNTSASYMLAAIVEKVTGMPLMDYLQPRLFGPLGIENATWDKSPEGIALGGYGLKVRTEDIARFGQMYLQKGKWEGRQILPETWVAEATSFQTSNGSNPASDWDQGYGYQFWRCRNHAFRGDGAFGQYCIVLPEQDAVIAITSGLGNMQGVLNMVWEKLLPAMRPGILPANPSGAAESGKVLKGLSLPTPAGATAPPDVFGKAYRFGENAIKLESLRLEKETDGVATLFLGSDGNDVQLKCGRGEWIKTRIPWPLGGELLPGSRMQSAAACAAWTSEDTLMVKLCLYETPFVHTLKLRFSGDQLHLNAEANVGFGPTKQPELLGKAVPPGNK
jgi:CubicO group peptidase (beta-lactamase class C family)